MASSAIVIKVKFGETLRRFSAYIYDKKLVLDIVMLRAKIRSLFSFDFEVDFTLTYVDEDGDTVTLVDDDDLHDVVQQFLNPLRITVKLNSKPGGSGASLTPLRSLQDQLPLEALNSKFSEFLKSVPEHLRDSLTKLPLELASKATSSTSLLLELMENMKVMYLNQVSDAMAGPKVHPTSGGASDVNDGKGKNSESSIAKDSKVVDPEVGSTNKKKKEEKFPKVTEGVKLKDVRPVKPVDLNVPYFEYETFLSPIKSVDEGANKQVYDIPTEKKKDSGSEKKDVNTGSSSTGFANPLDNPRQYDHDCKVTEMGGSSTTNDSGSFSGWAQGMLDGTNQCPFVGMPHWKSHSHGNDIGSLTFHMGVCCDGCGVHPITGPRYKSKVKEDYDLCSVCFAGMGNVADYIRMDRPTTAIRHHMPFKGFHDPALRVPPPKLPHAMRAPGAKLDCRFIFDVSVLDGTLMAPLTEFTKIWRMRNNGTIMWPRGSQLQWVGGDRLSNSAIVDVEIPADGLLVDKELDVAVDFTAPELPGRYISYWRMASPSGQKFGQRVWVLIQVDASMKDLGETSINLNLPPVTRDNFMKVTDSEDKDFDSQPKDQEMNFPINDTLIINNGGVSSTKPASSSVFSSTEVKSALASLPNGPSFPSFFYSPVYTDLLEASAYPTVNSSKVPPTGSEDREKAYVRELEEMGFKQLDLNKEILRMNNYDLEKSIDDLCGVSDWDPVLGELQEMGFADNEANRRLLKKNNGSIKHVVMDLINGDQA